VKAQEGWRTCFRGHRRRSKEELIAEMNEDLARHVPSVDWSFSQNIRDNVMEVLSGVKGENSVKIIGPDLDELERLAEQVKATLAGVHGVENAGVLHIKGQVNLEFPIDRAQCALWNVSVADVHNVIETAVGGKPFTQMIEGEKSFDISLRWPEKLRNSEEAILNIPVNVVNNTMTPGAVPGVAATLLTGASGGVSATGTSLTMPAAIGSILHATHRNLNDTPQRPLAELVTPLPHQGEAHTDGIDTQASYVRPGASTIYREQGKR